MARYVVSKDAIKSLAFPASHPPPLVAFIENKRDSTQEPQLMWNIPKLPVIHR